MDYRITLENDDSDGEVPRAVRAGIRAADPPDVPARDREPLCLALRDAHGAIVGGVYGATMWSWLMIDGLWVAEQLRGRGFGSRLLAQGEAIAMERGCRGAWLGTFDFQAREFYERHGYTVFGELAGKPEGHTHFHLQKRFGPQQTGNDEMWDAPDIVPAITYADLPRAIEWLQNVFGFRERAAARLTWPGGGMAWMEAGNGLFGISTPDETWGGQASAAAAGFVMKVYVDDVDRHFARAKALGATVVSEPQDGFWGGRVYRVLDHEGNRWEISQRGRDLAADRWQLPPDVVRGPSQ